MRIWRLIGVAVAIAALSAVFVPKAGAQVGFVTDQRVILTFNQSVGVPDRVLDPGTYMFKVIQFLGTRDIVQVSNKGEDRVFGTYITVTKIWGEHGRPPEKVVVTFRETPAGMPKEIDAWWRPGFEAGHQFIYPKSTPVQLAKVENEPAPSQPMPEEPSLSTPPEASTVPIENPPATVEESTSNVQPLSAPAELPKTASSLPLVGLIGLLSLAGSFGLLIVTRRIG
jgi:hypothetical protein